MSEFPMYWQSFLSTALVFTLLGYVWLVADAKDCAGKQNKEKGQ